jgi:hypothetical protein
MADKKMSQLEELGTLNSYDIMHIVTDPTNNAVNRKGTIAQIFGGLNHTTTQTEVGGKTFVKADLTITDGQTYTGNLVSLFSSTTSAPASTTTIGNIYGQKTELNLTGTQGTYNGEVVGHEIVLNLSDTIGDDQLTSVQYGLKVLMKDSDSNRTHSPDAFICLNDNIDETLLPAGSGGDLIDSRGVVTNLFALGDTNGERIKLTANGQVFHGGNALVGIDMNSHTVLTGTGNIAKIKMRVNGANYYLLATSNGHSADVASA